MLTNRECASFGYTTVYERILDVFEISDRVDKWLYGEYQKRMDRFKALIEEDLKGAKEFREVCCRFLFALVVW